MRAAAAAAVLSLTLVYPAITGEGQQPPAGIPITPDLARALYERLASMREADGCRLSRAETAYTRVAVGLRAPSGAEHALTLKALRPRGPGCATARWEMTASVQLRADCPATLAAIRRVLAETPAPHRSGPPLLALDNHALLGGQMILLLLGTVHILCRETRVRRPAAWAVLSLWAIWAVALLLRLGLSPRTFLHEYYHIAETVTGYLIGEASPAYGKTGPALFRLVAGVLQRPDDVQVIFLTNAVLASLAIPAVALFDLALSKSWARALCAAMLLCVLPQHLRFSAAEDLFIQAVTFGLWTLALFALYVRTRRLEDALCAATALSLAVQTRPEMTVFPAVLVVLVLLAEPRSWRVLFAWRTLLALMLAVALLIPRFLDLRRALAEGGPSVAGDLDVRRYLGALVLLDPRVTPPIYWLLSALGLLWGVRRNPGLCVWVLVVFVGFTLATFALFDNPQYHLRAQLLPGSFVVLLAAGVAPLWMEAWGRRRAAALAAGAGVLVVLGVAVVVGWRGFVTELRDQQLEWAFLERTVPLLPERGRLLTTVEVGGYRLNAFPDFLLWREGKSYEMIDVRRAAAGEVPWPGAGDDLLFYQGMFCHFAALPDEPLPDPLSATCRAVHERYEVEPLLIEDLDTQGYSYMPYGPAPFRIGFFRLRALR